MINPLSILVSIFTNPAIATIIGAFIAGIIGIITAQYMAKRTESNNAKISHLTELKNKCLIPLEDELHFVLTNELKFSNFRVTETNMPILANSVRRCYRYLTTPDPLTQEYISEPLDNHSMFVYDYEDFSFEGYTKGLERSLYNDMEVHFPEVMDNLKRTKKFIQENVTIVRKNIYDICKFLYEDKKYNAFLSKIILNADGNENTVKEDYFLFSVLATITGNQIEAHKYLPSIKGYGGWEECLHILTPYRSMGFINTIDDIQNKAYALFSETLECIKWRENRQMLDGICNYVSRHVR